MSQLDLFRDAPRDYEAARRHLARLELADCRAAVGRHRQVFPRGTDPVPVLEAADWLETVLAGGLRDGPALLAACLTLREGRAPGFAELGSELAAAAAGTLARRGLDGLRAAALTSKAPLGQGLPWGALHLFEGNPGAARRVLESWCRGPSASSSGWLALGDALWLLERRPEARTAYREGCGLDPACLEGWRVADPGLDGLRRRAQQDPAFGRAWWAVGACLGGGFPPFGRWDTAEAARRWELYAGAEGAGAPAPVVFYLGLGLSEQGPPLGMDRLASVRRALRRLHPEAFELHMENLSSGGPGSFG